MQTFATLPQRLLLLLIVLPEHVVFSTARSVLRDETCTAICRRRRLQQTKNAPKAHKGQRMTCMGSGIFPPAPSPPPDDWQAKHTSPSAKDQQAHTNYLSRARLFSIASGQWQQGEIASTADDDASYKRRRRLRHSTRGLLACFALPGRRQCAQTCLV